MNSFLQLSQSINKVKDRTFEIVLLTAAFVIRMVNVVNQLIWAHGAFYGGDTLRYSAWADEIIEKGFAYYAENIDKIYYWGYPTIIALVRMITGEDAWLMVINGCFSALAVVFLYRTAIMLFHSKSTALLAGLTYAYFPECMKWDTSIYSDPLGLFFEIFCIYLFFRYRELSGKERRRCIAALIFSEILFFLIRTTSSITIILIAIALIRDLDKKKKIVITAALVTFAALFLIVAFATAHGEHALTARLDYYFDLYKQGTIVFETKTFVYPVNSEHFGTAFFIVDIILIIICRFIFFWAMFFKSFDPVEKLLRGVSFSYLYITVLIGIYYLRKRKNYGAGFLMILILTTNIIQSFFEIDGAHRYRIPIIPWLIVIGAYGVRCAVKSRCDKLCEAQPSGQGE